MNNVDILLVEDNADDAELTRRALRTGLTFLTFLTLGTLSSAESLLHVEDGAQAIDYMFGTGEFSGRDIRMLPKLILLDLKLPKIDGLEVLRRIKSDDRTRSVPVVVLTSSSEERDIRKSYEYGVNSYVVKPVSFDDYLVKVGALGRYWLEFNRCISKDVRA